MNKKILYEDKKLIIYKNGLFLKKKQKTILFLDIELIFYAKWSFKNWFRIAKSSRGLGALYIDMKTFPRYKRGYRVFYKCEDFKRIKNLLNCPKIYFD